MPIINIEIMKTIDERELQKTKQKKNKQIQKGARGTEAIVKGWELNPNFKATSLANIARTTASTSKFIY